jgi:hypothetical protein
LAVREEIDHIEGKSGVVDRRQVERRTTLERRSEDFRANVKARAARVGAWKVQVHAVINKRPTAEVGWENGWSGTVGCAATEKSDTGNLARLADAPAASRGEVDGVRGDGQDSPGCVGRFRHRRGRTGDWDEG